MVEEERDVSAFFFLMFGVIWTR